MILNFLPLLADTVCTRINDADGHPDRFCTDLPKAAGSSANIQTLVHIFVGIIAVVAVLIIVVSALNLVTSRGDAAKVAKARSAILYSLIGLVIAVTADIIVAFVLGRLG